MHTGGKMHKKAEMQPTEYEQQRLQTIEANKAKMRMLGIKRICPSISSLVDNTKDKKKAKTSNSQPATTLPEDNDVTPDKEALENDNNGEPIANKKQKVFYSFTFDCHFLISQIFHINQHLEIWLTPP